ncbi:MAG TPA: disulfide bond formation protein B [Noviherbaspirillum sp.]|nr:disulfide bond formation protein B [Noviherbaspirillum sp.]
MKSSKPVLLAIAAVSLGLVGYALYLQHQLGWAPCPLCVIQRYVFVGVAAVCLLGALLPRAAAPVGAGLGALVALGGAGVASWHTWVKANPTVSCGIDPLETALNRIPPADWMPFLFKADGLCATPYPPILGLQVPHWSLIWFAIFALVLGWAAIRAR